MPALRVQIPQVEKWARQSGRAASVIFGVYFGTFAGGVAGAFVIGRVDIDVHLTQGGWLISQILELVSFSALSEPVFATKALNGLSEAFSLSFYND